MMIFDLSLLTKHKIHPNLAFLLTDGYGKAQFLTNIKGLEPDKIRYVRNLKA